MPMFWRPSPAWSSPNRLIPAAWRSPELLYSPSNAKAPIAWKRRWKSPGWRRFGLDSRCRSLWTASIARSMRGSPRSCPRWMPPRAPTPSRSIYPRCRRFARVSSGARAFQLGSRSLLAIPAGAVTERGQLQSVLVADNGVARTRLITAGQKVKDRIEVLSGLTAGEKVIFPVPRDLADGARVEVRP